MRQRSLKRSRTLAHWLSERWAYGLALLPALTDWFDAGHWPQHPREFATEIVVGLVIFVGVALLYRRADTFRTLSETDILTGLGNRARFHVDLAHAIERSVATATPLTVGIVDVDRFKEVNDIFGHAEGDQVLCEVGMALRRAVRLDVDGCYRLGGDEFAVVLFGRASHQAWDAVRSSFERASKALGRPISCSVGMVEYRHGEGGDDFVHRADRLMYAAKRDGWSCVAPGSFFGSVKIGSSSMPPKPPQDASPSR